MNQPGLDAGNQGDLPARGVIFFYEGYIGVQPTVANLAKAMGRAGYEVTVYAVPTWAPNAGDLGFGVKIEYLRPRPILERIGKFGLGRYRLNRVVARLVPDTVSFALRGTYLEVLDRVRGHRRTVYVGVDPEGALGALLSSVLLGRSYVFLSLHLKIIASLRNGLRGHVARLAYRRAACVAIQGRDRLDVLARELRWEHPHIFILPNSPYAPEGDAHPPGGLDLRNTLGIPATKKIALQAGMINDSSCAGELAKGFAGQPDWALILHERQKRASDEPYLARLRETNPQNLYLSLDPVPYDQVDDVFATADVGLAFYQPSGPEDDNLRLVSSSGKLPHYLKHGKPVLVSNLPSLVEVVETFECGIVIHDPSNRDEIAAALEQILDRYAEFSRNAARCFAERYDFGKSVAPLTRFMNDL